MDLVDRDVVKDVVVVQRMYLLEDRVVREVGIA